MSTIIEPLSLLSVPLNLLSYTGQKIAAATGIFWRKSTGETFLVSNCHVFSGNHYITQKAAHLTAIPATIEYPRFISLNERQQHTIALYGDDAGNDQVWRKHPIHDQCPVDIGIIKVPTIAQDGSYVYAVNDDPQYECDQPLKRYPPGCPLLTTGFFMADRPTGYFPIYIRGSVASEMGVGYDGKRAFLMDALTSAGMSGSPTFLSEPEVQGLAYGSFKNPFLGLYSGRITEYRDESETVLQVGIVWNRELIFQMVELS